MKGESPVELGHFNKRNKKKYCREKFWSFFTNKVMNATLLVFVKLTGIVIETTIKIEIFLKVYCVGIRSRSFILVIAKFIEIFVVVVVVAFIFDFEFIFLQRVRTCLSAKFKFVPI